ncbi:Phototropic-responsive NPH3 family protein [Arabidopsis thaliana]|uniref:BTB/POZ domain-containing protein At3g44820 n=1 Tax=Arabidopsis thaliana TaxID=3702 RepID=Y3482_ARATH|nr:Phototropic-responsive NPH3 family protein [Arabidopsis thaliana]Q9FYC8.2 RecName: Full=BTB/POZ domain-containing protein At3g44820 [Arabidopsis thaliana]AEE77958.1 Phototropic-responsive NPH3 family protein [Arabidopsis thaliana]|eukprot:NP_190068.4 Phototropic-responsive NPH3 family protein [Arabidopsis thaliana]
MSPVAKVSEFHREGNDWFCKTGLSSDITVVVDDVKFHLHKFPLVSKCGKLARMYEDSKSTDKQSLWTTVLEEFPGGADNFLIVARFCYGARVDITSKNLVSIHCAAEYLEMTNEYGEDNLISQVETFLHKHVLRNWKDCILALQSSSPVLKSAEKLQMIPKLMNAVSTMVCTDPSLFGWPMMMYGTLQSPGGSILWNGINTGARMRSSGSDWWYEDISYLSVDLFKRLIKTMETKGIRAESLAGAMMYYARKYLPGLGRWQSGTSDSSKSRRRVVSFNLAKASSPSSMPPLDQIALLETILSLLPEKRGRSFCKFLLGLLRVAFILGVDGNCVKKLEKRIGMQLELATLDNLLILNYSDSETLYNVDCVERIVRHFVSSLSSSSSQLPEFSPPSLDPVTSPSPAPLKKVANLVDSYMAEVASDVNLKPDKMRSLAAALPESSRPLYDGLYRAFDIYFKEHPWLSDRDKEQLCNIMDYQRLSIDACAHASHNDRLPLRVVLQVLFFEQMHLRTALAGGLNVANTETAHAVTIPGGRTGQEIVQRDGWVTVVRQNQVLKVDMQKMRSRVGELEEEFQSIKQEMKKRVSKSSSSMSSPRLVKLGCKFLLPRASDAKNDTVQNSVSSTPRSATADHTLPRSSRHSKHRKSFSFFG